MTWPRLLPQSRFQKAKSFFLSITDQHVGHAGLTSNNKISMDDDGWV